MKLITPCIHSQSDLAAMFINLISYATNYGFDITLKFIIIN